MNTARSFDITAACAELLDIAFTKADARSFDKYYASLVTDAAIDLERSLLKDSVDQVFIGFRTCTNVYQVRKLIKDQPLNIKAFAFERLVIILQVAAEMDIDIVTSRSPDYGQAFSETIQRLWNHLLAKLQENEDSVSEFYRHILQGNPSYFHQSMQ